MPGDRSSHYSDVFSYPVWPRDAGTPVTVDRHGLSMLSITYCVLPIHRRVSEMIKPAAGPANH